MNCTMRKAFLVCLLCVIAITPAYSAAVYGQNTCKVGGSLFSRSAGTKAGDGTDPPPVQISIPDALVTAVTAGMAVLGDQCLYGKNCGACCDLIDVNGIDELDRACYEHDGCLWDPTKRACDCDRELGAKSRAIYNAESKCSWYEFWCFENAKVKAAWAMANSMETGLAHDCSYNIAPIFPPPPPSPHSCGNNTRCGGNSTGASAPGPSPTQGKACISSSWMYALTEAIRYTGLTKIITHTRIKTVKECAEKCINDDACLLFNWSKRTKACTLFPDTNDRAVADNNWDTVPWFTSGYIYCKD